MPFVRTQKAEEEEDEVGEKEIPESAIRRIGIFQGAEERCDMREM